MDVSDLLAYLRIIWKRLWLILLLMFVTLGVIVAMVVTEPPVYRATVRLQVIASDPLFTSPTAKSTTEELIGARDDFVSALSSSQVAWKTIGQLELGIDAVDLLNHISIAKVDLFVSVNVEAATPELAFKIAETHVNNALDYYRSERARPARAFRDFLSAQLKEEGQSLSKANNDLLEFRLKNNMLEPDAEATAYQNMVRDLQLERDRTEIAAIRAEAVATDLVDKAEDAAAKADEAQKRQATATAAYFSSLAQRYSTQAIDNQVAATAARAALTKYDQLIAQKRSELQNLIRLGDVYISLGTATSRAEGSYDFLLGKENEARLRESQAKSVGFIEVLEPARYPDRQAASKLPRLVMIGAVVSFLAGIILAFLIEFLESFGQPPVEQERKLL